MNRVTSDFWASALMRRIFADGGFAAVTRRGAAEAGAIFLIARDRLGTLRLYGPAPQTSYDEDRPSERRFSLLVETVEESELSARLGREMRFDPDVWIVEIEPGRLPLSELIEIVE
jgi:hypothetical protein